MQLESKKLLHDIHGYDIVDDQVVWDVIQRKLPVLLREVLELLTEETEHP